MRAALRTLLLAMAVVGAPAWADEREAAIAGHVADVGTTVVGLAMGAAESNPLGLVALGAKVIMAKQIEQAPVEEQPRLWNMWGAFGWGASANNLCVIVAIASGGVGAPCLALGVLAGVVVYSGAQSASVEVSGGDAP